MWELLDTRWCFSYRYKLVKCHAHTGVSEMLSRWVGLGNDTALGKLVESENQEDQAFITGHRPQPVVLIGTIVFIHEPNKAESVLKAFTVRFRAHE